MYPPGADYDWVHILDIEGNPFEGDERPITNMNISNVNVSDEPIDNIYKNEFNEFVNTLNPNSFVEDRRRTKYLLDQVSINLEEDDYTVVMDEPNTIRIQEIQGTPETFNLPVNVETYIISFVNDNIRLEYGDIFGYQFIALYQIIDNNLARCWILGLDQGYPFIY